MIANRHVGHCQATSAVRVGEGRLLEFVVHQTHITHQHGQVKLTDDAVIARS